MSKLFRAAIVLIAVTGLVAFSAPRSWAQNDNRLELGAEYSYVRTNAGPGDCGCFSLNGATGWFAYNFSRSWAAVGEIGGEHASNINGTTGSLTLSSYLAGARYAWRRSDQHRFVPFGQYLIGGAHASGDLTPALDGQPAGSNALAMSFGAGVDARLSRHWVVRLPEVDYFLTRFENGVNHHQNNLRIGVGFAYRFGGGRK